MSGTLIPMQAQGINPLPTQSALAGIAQTQAQTGLIGQQTTAAQIQNLLAGIRVGAIAPALGMAVPNGIPGVAPASGGQPAQGGGGMSGPAQSAGMQTISPYGAVQSPFGVAVPGLMAVQAITAADPSKAWESAIQTRARTLSQLIAPVTNVGEWNSALQTAYASGYMTPQDYASMYNHPEHRQALMNSFADPNQHIETLRDLAGKGMGLNAYGMPVTDPAAVAAAGAKTGAEKWAGVAPAIATAGGEAAARLPFNLAEKGFARGENGVFSPIAGGPADPAYRGAVIGSESGARVPAAVATAAGSAAGTLPYDLAKSGFTLNPDRSISPIAGGPADPTYVGAKAVASAQAQVAPMLQRAGFALQADGTISPIAGGPADPNYKGAVSGAQANAVVGPRVIEAQAKPYNLGPSETRVVPPVPGQGLPLSAIADPNKPIAPADWAQRSMFTEGGPGTGPRLTPGSSAQGGQSFIDGTWLSLMRSHHPDLTQGKSDADVLAMRSNDGLSNQLALDYASDNAPQLAAAGVAPNSSTLKLAHFLGPVGAIKTMQAPEGTPMARIVSPEAMKANPQLGNMTNSQLYGQTVAKFGVGQLPGVGAAPPAQSATGAPAQSQFTGATPAPTIAPNVAPLPGGGTTVTSGITPNVVETARANADAFKDYRNGLLTQSQGAIRQNALLQQAIPEVASWEMGPFADSKMKALSYLDSARNNINAMVGKEVLGPPDQSIGDWGAFNKTMNDFLRTAVRETSSRAAVQEFPLIERSLPMDTTSPQSFSKIGAQIMGINDWVQAKSKASANASGAPNSFDSTWNEQVPLGAYILNRMSTPDAQVMAHNLAKTEAGRTYWKDLMGRMKVLDQGGMLPKNAMTMDAMRQPSNP